MKETNSFKKKFKTWLKSNLMFIAIILSIIIGFSIGLGIRLSSLSENDNKLWFTLPGKLFIRSLELLIIPVIFFGVVSATSMLNPKTNAKLSLICVIFIYGSHLVACVLGITSSFAFSLMSNNRTNNAFIKNSKIQRIEKNFYDIVSDIFRSLIPKNIIRATINQEITKYNPVEDENGTITFKRSVVFIDGTNLLGILVFALFIGIASSIIGEKGAAFRSFIESTNYVFTKVLSWFIMIAPIGIASLIIDTVLDINDFKQTLAEIGLLTVLVTSTCLFYGIIVLSIVLFLFIRKNPFIYFLYFAEPILLAFASTSGAVCIHKAIEVCEQKLKMNPTITRFSLPFFTALQSDGSSIFITLSSVFLARINNIELSLSDYVVIILLTSILCLSLPSVPSSSLVTIIVILGSINLGDVNIAILYTVEWILDRVRTSINVYSHCICTVIIEKIANNSKYIQVKIDEDKVIIENGAYSNENENDVVTL